MIKTYQILSRNYDLAAIPNLTTSPTLTTPRLRSYFSSTSTSPTCSHRGRRHTNTIAAARLQQRQPFSSTDGAAIRRPCVLCRYTPCVESVADRTESLKLMRSSTTTFKRHLKTFLFNSANSSYILTIECIIGLIVGNALQMQLLPLLLLLPPCCYCL